MLSSASRLIATCGCGRRVGATIVRSSLRRDRLPVPVALRFNHFAVRHASSGNGGGKDDDDGVEERDPFGVDYEDGDAGFGPDADLPPRYVRDPVSGKLTGETETDDVETTKTTNAADDDDGHDEATLARRLTTYWSEEAGNGDDGDDGDEGAAAMARAVRRRRAALHAVGRAPSDEVEAPLSRDEFEALREHAASRTGANVTENDLPLSSSSSTSSDRRFDPDRDLSWIGASDADAFGDLETILPSDLTPPRRLNRREANPLPKELLHHNNVDLLRRYVTPGGQIMDRTRSKLGSKDQRKIAKLVKRARHLGLIPHVGQWKYEDHGDLFADDINEDREWEKELKRRGLDMERNVNKSEE